MADFEVIQIALSEPPDSIINLMEETKSKFNNYKLITEWDPHHKEFYTSIPEGEKWHWLRSDVIRFEYLSQFENILYLDWDVKVNNIPNFNGITWAPQYDHWAIFNSNKTDVFKQIIDESIEYITKIKDVVIKKGWISPFIFRLKGNVFNSSTFTHYGNKIKI